MYKENLTAQKQPLSDCNNNSVCQTPKIAHKATKKDHLISAVEEEITNNQGCDLINVILADPMLKELNVSLEKQAEQQKRTRLLQSFPLRYRNLVHTQMLYRKVQNQMKQYQKESKSIIDQLNVEKQELFGQIDFLKEEINRKEQILSLKQEEKAQYFLKKNQEVASKIQEKQKQVVFRDEKIADLQRKVFKVKIQKDNIVEYLEEIKDESQNLRKQNQKLIANVTSKDLQLSQIKKRVQDCQRNYEISKQNFMSQLMSTQLSYSETVDQKNIELADLNTINKDLKNKTKEYEKQIVELKKEKQSLQTQSFDICQELRGKLLQTVKQKNIIDEQYDLLKHDSQFQIQYLRNKITNFDQQIKQKDSIIEANKGAYQEHLNTVKETNICIQTTKNEIIRNLEEKIEKSKQQALQFNSTISNLEDDKLKLAEIIKQLEQKIDQEKEKVSTSSEEYQKNEVKKKQIDKMVKVLKEQLNKISQINRQKENKIQEYRSQIFSYRKQLKTLIIQKDSLGNEVLKLQQTLENSINENENLRKFLDKHKAKQLVLETQLSTFSDILNKEKMNNSTQFEIIEGFNDKDEVQQLKMQKQMNRFQSKYENALEQLQQYKKLFQNEVEQKEITIQQLQAENIKIKQQVLNKALESTQIQNILDSKIVELKTFYEQKMSQQNKKHKKVIGMLKDEMSLLYNQIDLKKSIEAEVYEEIMKINQDRNCHQQQYQQ